MPLRDQRWGPLVATLASLLVCASCTEAAPRESPPASSPPAVEAPKVSAQQAAPAEQPAKPLLSAKREIMGTWFELKVVDRGDPTAPARLERGLDEIARLEAVLSEWKPGTEISRINESAGEAAIPVGPETFAVVREGLAISKVSDGAFDLTWAAMRGLYKFEPGVEPVVPSSAEIQRLRAFVGYKDLQLDEEKHTVRLARKGMQIGTGGIAKGYALDVVAKQLEAAGDNGYLLFAGGQVLVHGGREGRPWRIGIKNPRDEALMIGFLELDAGSVSTSGDYEHYFIDRSGRRWHHILDLRTGYPATESVSVTLIAPTGIEADALSTACFVLGAKPCIKMLGAMPSQPQAVILDKDLRVYVTEGIRKQVHITDPALTWGT